MSETANISALTIELQVIIEAARPRVWKALVAETSRWWPRSFLALPDSRRFVIEPRLGGRVYETSGKGAGAVWYTVSAVVPPSLLAMVGHLAPPFGGPSVSMPRFTLEEDGTRRTIVRLGDAMLGRIDESTRACCEDGWRTLLEKHLKAHVEAHRAPARPARARRR